MEYDLNPILEWKINLKNVKLKYGMALSSKHYNKFRGLPIRPVSQISTRPDMTLDVARM